MTSKDQLFAIIKSSTQEFKNLGDHLSPEKLHQTGTLTKWAPRDDVIHCAYYNQQYADRLAWPRDHEPVEGRDYLKVNDEIWEKHQTETFEEAMKMLEDAGQGILRGLEPLSDEELNNGDTFTWMRGQSPALYVPGLVYVHGMIHIQYILVREGLIESALKCADKAYLMAENLDTSEVGKGRNLYNKACSYALAGRAVEAIPMVVKAVKLAPNLLEWSKQDSDLDCLREIPEFKAIYE